MFALVAVVIFVLAALHVQMGNVDLTAAGLVFVALHLLFGAFIPVLPWRKKD